jgi:hypothetical protein
MSRKENLSSNFYDSDFEIARVTQLTIHLIYVKSPGEGDPFARNASLRTNGSFTKQTL